MTASVFTDLLLPLPTPEAWREKLEIDLAGLGISSFWQGILDETTATAALAGLGIVSGTYLPVLTAVSNVDATTAYRALYPGRQCRDGGRAPRRRPDDRRRHPDTVRYQLPGRIEPHRRRRSVQRHNVDAGQYRWSDPGERSGRPGHGAPLSGTTTNAACGYSFMYTVL